MLKDKKYTSKVRMKLMSSEKTRPFAVAAYMFDILYHDGIPFIDMLNKKIYLNINEPFDLDWQTLLHECLHFACRHHEREMLLRESMGKVDPELFNIAADHVINSIMREIIPKEELISNEFPVIEDIPGDWSVEKVYRYLLENRIRVRINLRVQDEFQGGNHQNQWIQSAIEIANVSNNVAKSEIINSMRSRGRGTSDKLIKILNMLDPPRVDWTSVMDEFIKSCSRSFSPRYLRRQYQGIYLPEYTGYDYDTVSCIVCSIDTSASISRSELEKFVAILSSMLNYVNKVIVVTHDYVVKQVTELEGVSSIDEFTFKGRGGTSHSDVFRYIQKLINDNIDLSGYVILSDFESDISQIYKEYLDLLQQIPIVAINCNYKMTPDLDVVKNRFGARVVNLIE